VNRDGTKPKQKQGTNTNNKNFENGKGFAERRMALNAFPRNDYI